MRVFFLSLLLGGLLLSAQAQAIYKDPHSLSLLRRAIQHIYNIETEAAVHLVDSLQRIWPKHPAPDVLKGLQVYWKEGPITEESSEYAAFLDILNRAAEKANKLWKEKRNTEAILFEISARGMLAERYANEGHYLESLKQAKAVYDLIMLADKLRKKNADFYFMVGLYNYFREKYPEEYPVYRPLMSFFRSGNKQLGLQQIDTAARTGILSRPEANTYLAYIYLRYERKPKQSLQYLEQLYKDFPGNFFYTTKLAEAYINSFQYARAEPLIKEIKQSSSDYYKLASHYLSGYVEERHYRRLMQATTHYKSAIVYGKRFRHKGSTFRASAYLGLGRIAEQRAERKKAIDYYKKASTSTRHASPRAEARKALRRLRE